MAEIKYYGYNSDMIQYNDTWSTSSSAGYKYANAIGKTAVFEFKGTGCKILGYAGKDCGYAGITLNNKPLEKVDWFDENKPKKEVYSVEGLDPTKIHRVEISVLGERNNSSTGTYVQIQEVWILDGELVAVGSYDNQPPTPDSVWQSAYPQRPVVSGYTEHIVTKRTDGICLYMFPTGTKLTYQTSDEKLLSYEKTGFVSYWYKDGTWEFRSEAPDSVLGFPPSSVVGGVLQASVNVLESTIPVYIDKVESNIWMEAFEFWKEPEPLPPEEETPEDNGGGDSSLDDWEPDPSIPYFTFNGVECPSFLKVLSVGMSVLPSIEVSTSSVAGRYGVLDMGTTFGEKAYTIEVMLVNRKKSLFQMASELAEFLKGDNWKPSKLTFRDLEGKHLMAKVQNSVSIEDLQVAGSGAIEFLVPTPVYVADEETTLDINGTSFNIQNKGTHPVAPVFTVKMTSSSDKFEIKNTETGKAFSISHKLIAGDVIEVDMNRKLIKLNGVINLSIFNIASDWLELSQGNNPFIVNTSATINVKFTELYG